MITGIKGMNDILPEEIPAWHFIEARMREVFHAFGFSEIRVPIVEKTELFHRSIGEETDIVEKEMYTFADRNGHSLTLRPEGTASVMRACIEHSLHVKTPVSKLYYVGPMFRYERPQKGRYRQFHQIGAEFIGEASPMADAQLLHMLTCYFRALGIPDVSLQINSLGCRQCRPAYRAALADFACQAVAQPLCDTPGLDLRVYMLGDQPVQAMLRRAEGADFRSNFGLHHQAEPLSDPPAETLRIARAVARRLGSALIGVDFIRHQGRWLLNEAEDAVGTRMLYQYTPIDIVKLYFDYILEHC